MKVSPHQAVTFLGATISIGNFILSVFYSSNAKSDFANRFIMESFGKSFQFIFYTSLVIISSFITIKLIAWINNTSNDRSLVLTIVALTSLGFAWLVAFDVKQSFNGYILEHEGGLIGFHIVRVAFYLLIIFFLLHKLSTEIKRLSLRLNKNVKEATSIPDDIFTTIIITYLIIIISSDFVA